MATDVSPEELIAEVNVCYSDMVETWGKSWKTELLERLMADSKTMQDAWKEIAKRSHKPTLDKPHKPISIYGLCLEFIDISNEAQKFQATPRDEAERLREIAKKADRLASAIDGTKLDRVADPFLKAEPDKPTPLMSTLLEKVSSEAKALAIASKNGPNILQRPGARNSTRTYVIRRLATLFDQVYGGHLQRTLAGFAQAILGEGYEVTTQHVNSALQHWTPVEFDGRGEYL